MDSDTDEENVKDPYRDDPVWQTWHANACDVQGGADGESTSEDDDGDDSVSLNLPGKCVCERCRLVND